MWRKSSARSGLFGSSKKDRRAYDAYLLAMDDAEKIWEFANTDEYSKCMETKLMKDLGYAKGYEKYTQRKSDAGKIKNKKYLKKFMKKFKTIWWAIKTFFTRIQYGNPSKIKDNWRTGKMVKQLLSTPSSIKLLPSWVINQD